MRVTVLFYLLATGIFNIGLAQDKPSTWQIKTLFTQSMSETSAAARGRTTVQKGDTQFYGQLRLPDALIADIFARASVQLGFATKSRVGANGPRSILSGSYTYNVSGTGTTYLQHTLKGRIKKAKLIHQLSYRTRKKGKTLNGSLRLKQRLCGLDLTHRLDYRYGEKIQVRGLGLTMSRSFGNGLKADLSVRHVPVTGLTDYTLGAHLTSGRIKSDLSVRYSPATGKTDYTLQARMKAGHRKPKLKLKINSRGSVTLGMGFSMGRRR